MKWHLENDDFVVIILLLWAALFVLYYILNRCEKDNKK